MKIINVYLERTFNLGDYNSLKVGFEAVLNESDKPLDVTRDLENLAYQHFENRKAPQPKTPEAPTAKATPTPKPDYATICPKCGKPKKPQYDVCYTCNMERSQK